MSVTLCRLDKLADIRLGVKTFLNPFFYVDANTINRFGIEAQFLEPVFRTRDAKRDRFVQKASDSELRIFLCDRTRDELQGTGAAAYITWASKQRHPPRKGQPGVLWSETPAVKPASRLWYQNQAMPPPARIVLLKAFDDYFAPFILDRPIRVDQRFNQVVPRPGVDEDLLIGLLLSAWFVMNVETLGRTAMGQGALELPTETLREILVPDIRDLDHDTREAWMTASKDLLREERRPFSELAARPAQRKLDSLVMESLGLDPDRLTELYEDTKRLGRVRKLLAQGRGAIKRERFETDLAGVARDIATELKPLIRRKRFPEDFLPVNAPTQRVQLGNAPISVEAEGLVGQHHLTVRVDGVAVFEADLIDPIAELFIRAVQLNRREFMLPVADTDAGEALKSFDLQMAELDSKLTDLAHGVSGAASSLLRELAEQELNLSISRARRPIPGNFKEEL
jgi:hypothetical protein